MKLSIIALAATAAAPVIAQQHDHVLGRNLAEATRTVQPFEDMALRAVQMFKDNKAAVKGEFEVAEEPAMALPMVGTTRGGGVRGLQEGSKWVQNSIALMKKGADSEDYYSRDTKGSSRNTKGSYKTHKTAKSVSADADDIPEGQWIPVNDEDALEQCLADLDQHDEEMRACRDAANEPSYLFVQMAKDCTITRDPDTGKYYLWSEAYDPDTYVS